MCFGTIYNTTININGRHGFCSSYNSLSPFMGYGLGSFSPGCFGFGFNGGCGGGGNPFMVGAGMGLGFAAGMTLIPAIPAIFKGIGQGCTWLWNNAIAPVGRGIGKGCTWLWNNAIAPAGRAIGRGVAKAAVGTWNGIKAAGRWVGNGCKNLWNKIFHKKSKTEKADN